MVTGVIQVIASGSYQLLVTVIAKTLYISILTCCFQVKLLNKLASARASGIGGGSKVLTDLVEGLQEPAVAVELRLKIDASHEDLKGGYTTCFVVLHYCIISLVISLIC